MAPGRISIFCLHVLIAVLFNVTLPGCDSTHEHMTHDTQQWFDEIRWNHRLLIISGPDEDVSRQVDACRAMRDGMLDRDLIVVDVSHDPGALVVGGREDIPDAPTFRARFDLPEEEFQVVLVGKDGGVKERRSDQFDIEELFAIIDAMPMRMREMRERR